MKTRLYINFMLGALLPFGGLPALRAQSFSVPWFVVADGGGTTAAGSFSLTGTFGQWEANEQPLTNGLFSLTGGFWSYLANDQRTLFNDEFSGNFVDPSKWTASGNTVIETNGMMEVLNNVTDNGGVLTSVPFSVNSTGLITIVRQVFLHAQPSPNTNYPGTYFMGQFGITVGALAPFSVYYADMDYGDGVTYMARHGFFLARDGQSPFLIADQTNISAAIPPLWDTWFNETVTYDPASGIMEYFINDVSLMSFNVGALPPTNSPTMTLSFNAWGWWTGHEQLFEDLLVTQAASVPNTAPMIALSGNLAFGGVAVGATSNQTLTISNVGNATLIISNISYPGGYSGNWAGGSITNGGSTNVTVTFSPTAATNYSGTITINSDASGGIGAIPVSGFGANGTLTLTVDIVGKGIVTPDLNGKVLTEGQPYTLRAVAGSGQVFSNWTGSVVTNKNPLTFIMQSNTLLQANFVPSPFLSIKGVYNGLFAATNGVTEETAGMIKGLIVGPRGRYSGALLINGGSHAISGRFNLSGQASNTIWRAVTRGGPLAAELTLDWNDSPPQITGTVSGTNDGLPWVADLLAYRSTNDGSARYTILLAPTEFGLPGVPSGYGYVLMAKQAGFLVLNGALADGTVISQTVRVNETGAEPIYLSLYGNTGLLMGWVNMADGAPAGNLNWIKKAAPHSLLYSNGFTNLVIVQGAGWTNRSPSAAIALPAGQLNLSGGTLLSPLSFAVAVNDTNALVVTTNNPTNSLTGSINPRNGLLTITFGNGNGEATTIGKGAVLQDTTNAAGFFLDTTNAGSVILQP